MFSATTRCFTTQVSSFGNKQQRVHTDKNTVEKQKMFTNVSIFLLIFAAKYGNKELIGTFVTATVNNEELI